MNQSEFLTITCNLLKAREKSCVQAAIGFGSLLIGWKTRTRFLKPITKLSVITFDSQLKTTLNTWGSGDVRIQNASWPDLVPFLLLYPSLRPAMKYH